MEANVFEGLQDLATQEELFVLAIFSQAVSIPYLREIRSSDSCGINSLDLGPLHWNLLHYIQRLSQDTSSILGDDATPESTSFDKKPWARPELFSRLKKLQDKYPHLDGLLRYFATGAARAFARFSAEFEKGGVIDSLTPQMRIYAWMLATNDINEGALGRFRVISRRCPNLTEEHYNAIIMSKQNGTVEWMESNLTDEHREIIRGKARKIDSLGLEKSRRLLLAEYHVQTVEKARQDDAGKKARKEAIAARLTAQLAGLEIILHPDSISWSSITGKQLDLQLEWHRRIPNHSVPMKSTITKKEEKMEALKNAIIIYNSRGLTYHLKGDNVEAMNVD